MITKDEVLTLLNDIENYHIERTVSTDKMDKFCQAICAFSNDMPNSGKKGYLIIGAADDGVISGLKVDDKLYKTITSIHSDGNIQPFPIMSVEKFSYDSGDLLVVEVTPHKYPPIKYKGRTWIRIGPRKDIASEMEERALMERRRANILSFETYPCIDSSLDDLKIDLFKNTYLPTIMDEDALVGDKRDIKQQLSALRLYNTTEDCPTYAAILLFGKNPEYYLPGAYVQYVRFDGDDNAADIVNEHKFAGCLIEILPKLDTFIETAIVEKRPKPITALREKTIYNYPIWAIRELLMNAVMHRDYQSNTPIKFYQYADRIEIDNAGGLYGNAKPENFPNVNDYRNPIVAEAMKSLGYVNRYNRGVARVQKELRDNGNQEAKFSVDNITVFGVKVNDATFVADNQLRIDFTNQVTNQATNQVDLELGQAIISCKQAEVAEYEAKYSKIAVRFDNSDFDSLKTEKTYEILNALLQGPQSKKELLVNILGLTSQIYNSQKYIEPLMARKLIVQTIKDRPRSPKQKYAITYLGCYFLTYLERLPIK